MEQVLGLLIGVGVYNCRKAKAAIKRKPSVEKIKDVNWERIGRKTVNCIQNGKPKHQQSRSCREDPAHPTQWCEMCLSMNQSCH